MSSPYSLHGADLINKGYCAIPCHPGAKYPGVFYGGQWMKMTGWTTKYASSLPQRMDVAAWSRAEGAGICLVLGRASRGVVAIDVDVDEAVNAVRLSFDATPVAKRGKKGCTFFFRGDVKSTAFNRENADGTRERLVDVLAEGRQTVLPPTVHPETGQPYEWIGSPLWEVDINDLPELPADALEMLEQALARYGYNPNKLRHTAAAQEPRAERDRVDSSEASFRGLNQHAMDHFELWVPKLNLHKLGRTPGGYEAVADWRSSCSGRPLEQRKKNLKIHREGIKDFGADKTYSPIDLVMAAQNMGDCFQAFEWLAEVTDWVIDRSKVISPNFEANMKRKQAERESAKADEPAPDKAADPEPAPVVVEIPPWRLNTPSPAVVSLPDAELAQCTGFVGRVADWIVQTARVQQPEFAMAGALVLTATLAGRRVVGPTGAGLQLYAIMAGKSASGKGHANNAMQSLLKSAGLLQRLRIGNFASGASVFTAMIDSPLSYAFVDEAGKTLFGRGKGKNAASHEQQIHAYLRQFWSESPTSTCYTEERVAERARACHGAALSLLCASSPEELFASCDSMDVINGFLNRFVLFQARSRVYHTPSPADVNSPPEQLVEDAKAIYYCPDDMSSARFHGRGDTELVADPDRVPWANQEVEEAYNAMTRWAIDRVEEDPVNGELYGRVAEYAVRIATIRAVGNNWTSPAITLDDLAWARALVLRSFENMISAVSENMAENDYERNRNRIHGYLKRKKKAMEMRDIQRGMTGLSKKQIDEIIDRLKSEERIEEVDVTDPKRDTKRKIAYRAVG